MEGAGWNTGSGCMPGTREDLLEEALAFIDKASDTAQIFKLTDVAGAGKSAFAHELARRCHERNILASSVFFAHDVHELSQPDKVITTIAREISAKNGNAEYADAVCAIIESEPTLASTFDFRQFEELLVKPSRLLPTHQSQVIVIDAIDECAEARNFRSFLRILQDGITRLPSTFRFIITARSTPRIETHLPQGQHVQQHSLQTHGVSNLRDVELYALHCLNQVARDQRKNSAWVADVLPGFLVAAGGLFIWVETVSEYLRYATDPDEALHDFATHNPDPSTSAERRMDMLYTHCLERFDWTDRSFMNGFHLVLGSILVAKVPLSLTALIKLHPNISQAKFTNILRELRAILSVPNEADQPIRIIHQSFHDFITRRAKDQSFYVAVADHNQQMAISCLHILNGQLKQPIPNTGYLDEDGGSHSSGPGIPNIPDGCVSEELWYACRFWTEHCISMVDPQPLLELVEEVIRENFVRWIEIYASKGSVLDINLDFVAWLKVCG